MQFDYYTFGHYSDGASPRTMLCNVMNSIASSGWEIFSLTNETTGFFRKRTTYLIHCRRPK